MDKELKLLLDEMAAEDEALDEELHIFLQKEHSEKEYASYKKKLDKKHKSRIKKLKKLSRILSKGS